MRKLILVPFLLTLMVFSGFGQRKIVNLPDIPGYVTLKCDFHIHTIFSDGNIWPTYRLVEAYRDGLDAIAITDHIEYTPHKSYVPVDQNAAWKLTEAAAKESNIILVHGAEITRSMPPGHINALFITDAEALRKDSVWDVVGEAVKQGAFIQWNHPGWKAQQPDGIPRMYDLHKRLIAKGWINGIEYFNEEEYYPLVFTFCEQYNLALMGNSDIHGVISEKYTKPDYTNRPMTLVLAKEKTAESLKEAMFAGRTLVYFGNMLVGREQYVKPFFDRCISIGKPFYEDGKNVYLEITNNSDLPFYLVNGVSDAPKSVTLAANSVTRVVLSKKIKTPLVYDVKNVITGENKVLKVALNY